MEQDMEDIIKKITNIINESPSNKSSINKNDLSENPNNSNYKKEKNNINDIDIDTILKLKNTFDKINSNNTHSNNLLYALKPYLRNEKKQKLDKYIQFMNIAKVMNIYNNEKPGDKNDKSIL